MLVEVARQSQTSAVKSIDGRLTEAHLQGKIRPPLRWVSPAVRRRPAFELIGVFIWSLPRS